MDEAAVVDQPSEAHPPEENRYELVPYHYPEFTGPSGKRYLKKVLRQILPMALYRTWEIFADYQAKGNECYLSISRLAVLAGRSLRTMQKNLASLQAKGLLVERVEWKLFQQPDGSTFSRLVVIKDFAALYTLAHEYHEWLQTTEMIPPERAFAPVIAQEGWWPNSDASTTIAACSFARSLVAAKESGKKIAGLRNTCQTSLHKN